MLESEKLAIAAHLHVLLRRKVGRVTDVEWMVRNTEYAKEVIRVARAETAHPELADWANRMHEAIFGAPPAVARAANPGPSDSTLGESGFADSRSGHPSAKAGTPRYVASLR